MIYQDTADEHSVSKGKKMLDWLYDKAVDGVAGFSSAEDMANDYMKRSGSTVDQANALIRWQNAKAGTSGLVTGLGGLVTMPFAVPANITSVLLVQLRMIAAIAHIGGHDVHDDRVRTLAYVCMLGSGANDVFKKAGIDLGKRLTTKFIKNMSAEIIKAINQKVGIRLVTKFGEKGVINLGKAIPIVGGVISGSADAWATNVIGNVARDAFVAA